MPPASCKSLTAMSLPGQTLDLRHLERLARDDPAAFERERTRLIEGCIRRAPREDRALLRCTQFRADAARTRSRTPLQTNLQLSRLMWESFLRLRDTLCEPPDPTPCASGAVAPVIPLKQRRPDPR